MEKVFSVSVDIVISNVIEIEAENEEDALIIAENYVADDPYEYLRDGLFVKCEATDAVEEE